MRQWSIRIALLIGSIVLAPILVELPIAYVKGESLRLDRALAVIAIILGALTVVFLAGLVSQRFRLVLLITLMIDGIATAALGVVIVLEPERLLTVSAGPDPLSVTALVSGLFVFGAACYLAYADGQSLEVAFVRGKAAAFKVSAVQHGDSTVNFGEPTTSTRKDADLIELCKAAIGDDDLHFVAFYEGNECSFFVDILDHQSLGRYLIKSTPQQRRDSYERAGRQLNLLMDRLNHHFADIEGGLLIRTVLDVEKGALYYYWVTPTDYLVGVTLDQRKVDVTDDKMGALVDAVRAHYSLPAINQREPR